MSPRASLTALVVTAALGLGGTTGAAQAASPKPVYPAGFCRTSQTYLGTLLHYLHHGFPKTRSGQVTLLKVVSTELLAIKHYEKYARWKNLEVGVAGTYGKAWRLLSQDRPTSDQAYLTLIGRNTNSIANLNSYLKQQHTQSC